MKRRYYGPVDDLIRGVLGAVLGASIVDTLGLSPYGVNHNTFDDGTLRRHRIAADGLGQRFTGLTKSTQHHLIT